MLQQEAEAEAPSESTAARKGGARQGAILQTVCAGKRGPKWACFFEGTPMFGGFKGTPQNKKQL